MFTEYMRKWNLTPAKLFKIGLLGLVGVILLVFILRMLGSSSGTLLPQNKGGIFGLTAPSVDMGYADSYQSYGGEASMPGLSVRNIAPSPITPPYPGGGTVGADAEAYEVTDYSATIETRDLDKTCDSVAALKEADYVIFEYANTYDKGCGYTFKVQHDHVQEILDVIKAMNPKTLAENTYTIKRTVEDFTSQLDILNKKRASIDETLQAALTAYDEVTKLAIQTQNADSLANIINSKLNIIERLTQERININAQIEQLSRAKAEQLDKLEYTYFRVTVYENKFVDGKALKDSWKAAVKQFVADVNRIVQDMSINLLVVVLTVLQYALYFFIVLVVVKYGWKFARKIWRR